VVTDIRRFGPDPAILTWAQAARMEAVKALSNSPEPLRSGGTWAVGLDLLPNDADGTVAGIALPRALFDLPDLPLHRAQVSAVYPGYPQPSPEETPAAFAFRRSRDAAHLDGLLPTGPARQRMMKEPHAYVLGLALTDSSASPLVAWPGSAALLRAALARALAPHPPETWGEVDLTEAYQTARAEVFRTCPRVELPLRPGEALLLHRHILHGVAPWEEGATAPPEGRITAWFRPVLASVADWLTA
jgi:hypothetical protein